MPADALDRQVEPVLDPGVECTPAVKRLIAANAAGRKHHLPADRVVEAPALSAVLGHVLRGHAARAGLTVDERHQVTDRVLENSDR